MGSGDERGADAQEAPWDLTLSQVVLITLSRKQTLFGTVLAGSRSGKKQEGAALRPEV